MPAQGDPPKRRGRQRQGRPPDRGRTASPSPKSKSSSGRERPVRAHKPKESWEVRDLKRQLSAALARRDHLKETFGKLASQVDRAEKQISLLRVEYNKNRKPSEPASASTSTDSAEQAVADMFRVFRAPRATSTHSSCCLDESASDSGDEASVKDDSTDEDKTSGSDKCPDDDAESEASTEAESVSDAVVKAPPKDPVKVLTTNVIANVLELARIRYENATRAISVDKAMRAVTAIAATWTPSLSACAEAAAAEHVAAARAKKNLADTRTIEYQKIDDVFTAAERAEALSSIKDAKTALQPRAKTWTKRLAESTKGESTISAMLKDPGTAFVAATSEVKYPPEVLTAVRKLRFGPVRVSYGSNQHTYSASVRAEAHRVAVSAAEIYKAGGAGEPFFAFASARENRDGDSASPVIVPRDMRNPPSFLPNLGDLREKRVVIMEDVYHDLDVYIRRLCGAPIIISAQEGVPPKIFDNTSWYDRDGLQHSSYAGASLWGNPGVNLVDTVFVRQKRETSFGFSHDACLYQAVNILGPVGSGRVVTVLHPLRILRSPTALIKAVGKFSGLSWLGEDQTKNLLITPTVHGNYSIINYINYRGAGEKRIRIYDIRSGEDIDMPRSEFELASYSTSGDKLEGAIGAVRKVLMQPDGSCAYTTAQIGILASFFRCKIIIKDPVNVTSIFGGGTNETAVAREVLPPLLQTARAPTVKSLNGALNGLEKRVEAPSTRALESYNPTPQMLAFAEEYDSLAAEAIRREGIAKADIDEVVTQLTQTPAQKARMNDFLKTGGSHKEGIVAMLKREIDHGRALTDASRLLSPTRIELTVYESAFTMSLYKTTKLTQPYYLGGCTADEVADAVHVFHLSSPKIKACVDVSKLDGSTLAPLRRQWRRYVKACFRGHELEGEIDWIFDQMDDPTCSLYINDDDWAVWFRSTGIILSGAPDTAVLAGWLNARLTYVANRMHGFTPAQAMAFIGPLCGDDSVKLDIPENATVFNAFGYQLKIVPQEKYVSPLIFLGAVLFQPAVSAAHVPETRRCLIRASSSTSPDDARAAQFKVMGGKIRGANSPLLSVYFEACERGLKKAGMWKERVNVLSLSREDQYKLRPQDLRKLSESETMEAAAYEAGELNLTMREYGELIKGLKKAKTLEDIAKWRIDEADFHSNLSGEHICTTEKGAITGVANTCTASVKVLEKAKDFTAKMKRNAKKASALLGRSPK